MFDSVPSNVIKDGAIIARFMITHDVFPKVPELTLATVSCEFLSVAHQVTTASPLPSYGCCADDDVPLSGLQAPGRVWWESPRAARFARGP